MSRPTARKRGRRGSPESWSVDAHVGQRVRMRRTLLGMSQEKLGEAIGLTFQQVQKYERGSNRISAGTLYRLGQVLDVPVSFFFDCYDDPNGARPSLRGDDPAMMADGQISRREARLLRLWRAAPANVTDGMLSLLSSISPEIKDLPDGQEDGAAAVSLPALVPETQQDRPATAKPSRTPRTEIRTDARAESRAESRAETQRVKAASTESQKPRRRHGAVWDPTDIYRSGKTGNRS